MTGGVTVLLGCPSLVRAHEARRQWSRMPAAMESPCRQQSVWGRDALCRAGTHRPRGDMGSGMRLTGRPDTEHATAMVPTATPTMDQALLVSREWMPATPRITASRAQMSPGTDAIETRPSGRSGARS